MEQKQEEDSRILSLEMEYGDDYDDQYDDTSGAKATSWQEEREKILRLNKLVRGEEAEDAYWSGMANTNHQRRRGGGGGGDEGSDEEDDEEAGEGGGAEAKPSKEIKTTPPGAKGGRSGKDNPVAAAPKPQQNHKQPTPRPTEAPKDNSKKSSGAAAGSGGPSGSAGSSGGANGGNTTQRKPKTKTFDKHHQKDKNTRKFGGFAP
jgi:hypothetical protein